MDKECYYRKGASVIYHYKERQKVLWSETGYGWVNVWKRATLVCPPRDEYGRFTNHEASIVSMTLRDGQGNVFTVDSDDVEKDRRIVDLTREELMQLWNEICKGSDFYSDYRNSLGVFEETACDFYDGYWKHLCDFYETDGEDTEQYDTAEEFADYVKGYCAA